MWWGNMLEMNFTKKLLMSTGYSTLKCDIKVPTGSTTGLFGKSGTGKTTTLRIIAGLTTPDTGTMFVNGTKWLDTHNHFHLAVNKRSLGFVFQDYALFPNMSVKENIQFAQTQKDKDFVSFLLHILGLESLQHQNPYYLSGGQKQRVALARAIARKPKILLLDEPLSALDTETRLMIQDEMKQLIQELGMTAIIVTHDMSEITKLCNHYYSFNDNEVNETKTGVYHGNKFNSQFPNFFQKNNPVSSHNFERSQYNCPNSNNCIWSRI
jgi:molybdate transport system ATP-binding protein